MTAADAQAPIVPLPGRAERLLAVDDLRVTFPVATRSRRGASRVLVAVDGVSFFVRRGETVALVGESGSGKTTVARAIVRLQPAEAGHVWLGDVDLLTLKGEQLRKRRRHFQMIFQDPYSSLDPRRSVGDTIAEPMVIHQTHDRHGRADRVARLLEHVGLDPAVASRRPHEFSGGQRQRIGIARALAVEPELLVCDEPVSALDVSVRAQVVNLLVDLQAQFGLTYVFIAHDLALVRHIASSVAVMYLGRIVESGPATAVYGDARHPYTVAMLSAVPIPDAAVERERRRIILKGDLPSPIDLPSGCRFSSRCWLRDRLGDPELCTTSDPPLTSVSDEHDVACHFPDKVAEDPRAVAILGKPSQAAGA